MHPSRYVNSFLPCCLSQVFQTALCDRTLFHLPFLLLGSEADLVVRMLWLPLLLYGVTFATLILVCWCMRCWQTLPPVKSKKGQEEGAHNKQSSGMEICDELRVKHMQAINAQIKILETNVFDAASGNESGSSIVSVAMTALPAIKIEEMKLKLLPLQHKLKAQTMDQACPWSAQRQVKQDRQTIGLEPEAITVRTAYTVALNSIPDISDLLLRLVLLWKLEC